MSRDVEIGSVGPYTFFEVHNHGFERGDPLYRYMIKGYKPSSELYESVDYAMAAAIAERHTGRRGAGGTAVGTASDWFMAMLRGWKS